MPAAERYHPIEVSECTIAHRNSLFHINGHTTRSTPKRRWEEPDKLTDIKAKMIYGYSVAKMHEDSDMYKII